MNCGILQVNDHPNRFVSAVNECVCDRVWLCVRYVQHRFDFLASYIFVAFLDVFFSSFIVIKQRKQTFFDSQRNPTLNESERKEEVDEDEKTRLSIVLFCWVLCFALTLLSIEVYTYDSGELLPDARWSIFYTIRNSIGSKQMHSMGANICTHKNKTHKLTEKKEKKHCFGRVFNFNL